MSQSDLELQLKVWKDLAVSKQILIRAATDALNLAPECSQAEFKVALEAALKKVAEAEGAVRAAEEQARSAIAAMEQKMTATEKALAAAEATKAELFAAKDKAEQQLANERTASAKEMKKVKDRLAEQERALKAINTALGDTPDNVLKKMRALRKQKADEADAHKAAEAANAALRKEKRQLEQRISELEAELAKDETQDAA